MSRIIYISNYKEYINLVNKYPNNYLLLYFFSNKCETCINLDPKLDKFLSSDYDSNIIFVKIDIDKSKDISNKLDITSYPVFRLYKNNEQIKEIYGTYDNIDEILEDIYRNI